MDARLGQYIDEFGGKHGSLLHFRENVEGGRDRVLPFEILSPGENFSLGMRRRVWAACKEYQTEQVIVRTSERSDWAGMVDVMPTMVTDQSFFGVRKIVDMIRERCHDPRILEYARKEGNGYDPNKVTVSVAPYLNPASHPRTLVTQHPNNDNARLVDVSTPYELMTNHFRHYSYDFDASGRMSYAYLSESMRETARSAMNVGRWIERSCQLPDTHAFQFEGAVFGSRGSVVPKLFQIRHFGERRYANFQIDGDDPTHLMRNFGVTPPEGVELEVARVSIRGGYARFEKEHPDVPYLLSVQQTTDQLDLTDQPTNMKGYFPDFKPALSHQATRMVQMVLRDPHGVTSLIATRAEKVLEAGGRVRVISDGVRQRIERV